MEGAGIGGEFEWRKRQKELWSYSFGGYPVVMAKFDLSVLKWHGIAVRGKLFDTMVAHSLIEPEMRHGMDYLSEVYLGYTPIPISKLIGEGKTGQVNMADVPLEKAAVNTIRCPQCVLVISCSTAPQTAHAGARQA